MNYSNNFWARQALGAFIVSSVLLSGCATTKLTPSPSQTVKLDVPAVGKITTIATGERMLASGETWIGNGLASKSSTNYCNQYGLRTWVLLPGVTYKENVGSDGKRYYCGKTMSYLGKLKANPSDAEYFERCIYRADDGVWKQHITEYPCYGGSENSPLNIEIGEMQESIPDAMQQTIFYNGKSGNNIFLSYREFINDTARPAFTQDLTFDVKEDRMVGVKGAILEILEYSNTSITYRVVSNFK